MNRVPKRTVTIKDVASTAGVSLQTVSRVVNASEQVALATREHVERVIEQLGYRRNELARNLIQGRSRTLGVVCASQDFLGGRNINSGITVEAEARGYSLLLKEHQIGDPESSPQAFIQSLLDRQVDGILWMLSDNSGEHEPVLRSLLSEHGMPVVALVKSRGVGVPSAAFDNFGAGVMATRHLIECGRKRIAHIAGKPQSWDAQERLRGWRFAMQEGGLPAGDEWIHFGDWAPQGGETGLRQLLDRIPGIDAVFASNDNTALGAMLAAHRLGKRIPEDIAFIGVDDIKGTGWFHPPLTTIRQNRVVMGRQAVRMLSEMIEARFNGLPIAPVSDYLSPPELIIRESS